MFKQVFDFNQNVLGIDPRLPIPLQGNEKTWLKGCLEEEAEEFGDAQGIVDQVDALIDSIIFAMGGLYRLGLSVEQAEACMAASWMPTSKRRQARRRAGFTKGWPTR